MIRRRATQNASLRRAVNTAVRLSLPLWFIVFTIDKLVVLLPAGYFGIDFRIYRHAAEVALSGGDPWASNVGGIRFAAPPPTLLPYLPFTFLSPDVGLALMLLVSAVAAIVTLRRLGLPTWWLLFPPLAESLIVLNPDVLVIAALVIGGSTAPIAPLFKIYGFVPLIGGRQWTSVALALVLVGLSLPWWGAYLARLPDLTQVLADQASGGLSAWGTPLLLPTVLALVLLAGRGVRWLAVPAMWPATQLHYACIALPALARRPILAAVASLAIPGLFPAALVVWAIMAIAQAWASDLFGPKESSSRLDSYKEQTAFVSVPDDPPARGLDHL